MADFGVSWYYHGNAVKFVNCIIFCFRQKLGELAPPESSIAQKPENRPKNRYKDLYPGNIYKCIAFPPPPISPYTHKMFHRTFNLQYIY